MLTVLSVDERRYLIGAYAFDPLQVAFDPLQQ